MQVLLKSQGFWRFGILIVVGLLGFATASLPAPESTQSTRKILFLGDSLTEGYGVPQASSYPQVIAKMLASEGVKNVKIINGGVSGSTTAGGVARLKWLLKGKPTHLVIALGSNDGLRGLKLDESRKNLESIIIAAKTRGIGVLLVGMQIPPNYGKAYTGTFRNMYQSLAKKHKIKLVPFLLKGVAGEPSLNISDGIHPNEKGHAIMAKNVFPFLLELIRERPNAIGNKPK